MIGIQITPVWTWEYLDLLPGLLLLCSFVLVHIAGIIMTLIAVNKEKKDKATHPSSFTDGAATFSAIILGGPSSTSLYAERYHLWLLRAGSACWEPIVRGCRSGSAYCFLEMRRFLPAPAFLHVSLFHLGLNCYALGNLMIWNTAILANFKRDCGLTMWHPFAVFFIAAFAGTLAFLAFPSRFLCRSCMHRRDKRWEREGNQLRKLNKIDHLQQNGNEQYQLEGAFPQAWQENPQNPSPGENDEDEGGRSFCYRYIYGVGALFWTEKVEYKTAATEVTILEPENGKNHIPHRHVKPQEIMVIKPSSPGDAYLMSASGYPGSVGASCGIFGVLSYFVFCVSYYTQLRFALQFYIVNSIFFVAISLLPGIDVRGHIGGALAGIACGAFFHPNATLLPSVLGYCSLIGGLFILPLFFVFVVPKSLVPRRLESRISDDEEYFQHLYCGQRKYVEDPEATKKLIQLKNNVEVPKSSIGQVLELDIHP